MFPLVANVDEFRAARLKHEAKAKALAQRAVAAAAESGNFRDVADLFVGATFADGDKRGAAERKGKSGAGGGVDVAWDDGTSAHLKWADAANRAVDVTTFPGHRFAVRPTDGSDPTLLTMSPAIPAYSFFND